MQIPGLTSLHRLAVVAWAVFGVLWIGREGDLRWVLFYGIWTTAMLLAYLDARLGERIVLDGAVLVMITAVWGALLGLGTVLITLLLMAIKTGVHAHGPEFSPAEIGWLMQQAVLWSLVGTIAGVGLGLLRLALGGEDA